MTDDHGETPKPQDDGPEPHVFRNITADSAGIAGFTGTNLLGGIANGAFASALGFDTAASRIIDAATPIDDDPGIRRALDAISLPTAGSIAAENTARMVDALDEQHDAIQELVRLTAINVATAKEQHERAEATERFSKRMTWISVVIAAASLAASIAAIAITVIIR